MRVAGEQHGVLGTGRLAFGAVDQHHALAAGAGRVGHGTQLAGEGEGRSPSPAHVHLVGVRDELAQLPGLDEPVERAVGGQVEPSAVVQPGGEPGRTHA